MNLTVNQRAKGILANIVAHTQLGHYIDSSLPIPQIYHGTDTIKLIILGQDPTVKNAKSRARITTVLNLDKPGSLHNYLSQICNKLGLHMENVYATNYLKSFFISPPTQIKEINIFKEFTPYWLSLLREELAQFPEVSIISLGQPLLSAIVCGEASPRVRDYWGYVSDWKSGRRGTNHFLKAESSILGRVIFPFPHQPSIGKRFYTERFEEYIAFTRQQLNIRV